MTEHPLEVFRFCPKCGSQDFKIHNALSRHCANCGFTFYQNPRVDNDENAEEGMVREIKEETGLDIDPETVEYQFSIPNVYHYSGMDIHTLDLFFLCHVTGEAVVKADDDAAELQWVPLREVYVERFGLRSIRQAVHRFLAQNC